MRWADLDGAGEAVVDCRADADEACRMCKAAVVPCDTVQP